MKRDKVDKRGKEIYIEDASFFNMKGYGVIN